MGSCISCLPLSSSLLGNVMLHVVDAALSLFPLLDMEDLFLDVLSSVFPFVRSTDTSTEVMYLYHVRDRHVLDTLRQVSNIPFFHPHN